MSPQVQDSTDASANSKFEVFAEQATVVVDECGARISGGSDLNDVGGVGEELDRIPLHRQTPGKGLNQGPQLHPATTYTADFNLQTLDPVVHNTTASVRASASDVDIVGRPAASLKSVRAAACAINCKFNIEVQGQVGDYDLTTPGVGTPTSWPSLLV